MNDAAQADDGAGRDPQEGLAAAPADGIKIPGDRLERCVQSLVREGKVTEAGGDEIRWFYQWAQGGAMSLSAAARAADISPTSLYRLLTATYAAAYDGLVAKLARFHKLEEQRSKRADVGFVETSAWRKIDAVCSQALKRPPASWSSRGATTTARPSTSACRARRPSRTSSRR